MLHSSSLFIVYLFFGIGFVDDGNTENEADAISVHISYRAETPLVTCKSAPVPNRRTEITVTFYVVLITILMFVFCVLLRLKIAEICKGQLSVTLPFGFFGLSIIALGSLIAWMPQKQQKLYFKVPFLPWIPILSLFFNTYLMCSLQQLTWIRFAVWMSLGEFIDCIFHRVAREKYFTTEINVVVFTPLLRKLSPLAYCTSFKNLDQ